MRYSRRQFCRHLGYSLAGCLAAPELLPRLLGGTVNADDERFACEARFYTKLDGRKVRCLLCPRTCLIAEGQRGFCRVRENRRGTLNTLVYSRLCTINNDPIEKKPLFHFLPGTNVLSVATAGCNLRCKFCQNWNISQVAPESIRAEYTPPERLVEYARQMHSPSIAFTYSEPTIFTEYVLDTARLARQVGIKCVSISNGFINPEPLRDLCTLLSAIKIDFKAYSDDFYQNVTTGRLQPVLDTMQYIHQQGIWLEIVNLLIPTQNDDVAQLQAMVQWIGQNLGAEVPVHFTRFHPQYLMENLPPTPQKSLETAQAIARSAGLQYVYIGNLPGHPAENTYCARCGQKIIERIGYSIRSVQVRNGRCRFCQSPIPGVWS